MGKVISVHSSRGGTGKTIIAVSLAMALLKKGFRVSLLDFDFRAPSLFNIFGDVVKVPVEYWINDFLNERCKKEQVLIDVTGSPGVDSKLLIGLANPSVYAVQDMMAKTRGWEASALKKLYSLRSFLLKNLNMDYVILDTSPGIQYSSINAIITSDLLIIVTTSDPLDIEGVRSMLREFYDLFEKRTLVLLNKVFPEMELLHEQENTELIKQLETLGHPIVGAIPCYCDVLRAKRDYSFSLRNPTHPFIRKLEEVAGKLVNY